MSDGWLLYVKGAGAFAFLWCVCKFAFMMQWHAEFEFDQLSMVAPNHESPSDHDTENYGAIRNLGKPREGHWACQGRRQRCKGGRYGFSSCQQKLRKVLTRPGLEPGISGSGDRRLIHWANGPVAKIGSLQESTDERSSHRGPLRPRSLTGGLHRACREREGDMWQEK